MDPFTEDFIADELPAACSQPRVGLIWLTHPLWNKYDEDCLTLNVYAPNVSEIQLISSQEPHS